jgi:transposase
MPWTIRINAMPVSGNKLLRMHWSAYRKILHAWWWKVRQGEGFLSVPKPTGKRHVVILLHGKRAMDRDNRTYACKPIMDVLRPPKQEQGVYKTGSKRGQVWNRERIGHGLLLEDDDQHVSSDVPPVIKLGKGEDPYIEIILSDIPEVTS